MADRTVQAGEEVVVEFQAAEKMAGYQFTLNFNGLEVAEVLPGANLSNENFAVFAAEKAITTSVDGNNGAFAVRFRATKSGSLSEMLTVGSRITRAEAYDVQGEKFEVAFRFNGANGNVVTGAGFELMQNTPNPVSEGTNITFNLPEATNATLTISNAEGRIVKVVNGSFAKGLNTIALRKDELRAGILFYQLDTPTNSAVRKMIVVE